MTSLSSAQRRALGALLQASPFAKVARELGERFTDAGHQLYLVGGTVRDALLERSSPDVDFTTDADPTRILEIVKAGGWDDGVWLQGARFGTVGVRKGTLRLPDGRSIDPSGGLPALANRRLRTPSSPATSFEDDPLRMLRAARFVAQLELVPTQETVEAITERVGRLEIVSRERIRDELEKLLRGRAPGKGLWLVVQTGLANQFLPELPALALEQDPVHRHKDVLAHTIAVVERATAFDADRPDLVLRLAALLHDIGKPRTRRVGPDGVSFHLHEVVGAKMAERRLQELRFSSEVVQDVRTLVLLHLRFHTYRLGWTDSAVRRYVRDAGDLLDRLNFLVRSDCTTRNPFKAKQLAAACDELEGRIARLEAEEELAKIKPPLNGDEVMALLGVPPGPIVGKALSHLLELRLDRGPMSTQDATEALLAWAREQGLELPGPGEQR